MFKPFNSFAVVIFSFIPLSILAEESFIPNPPSLNATNYILMDSISGRILAEKGADEQIEPASITKIGMPSIHTSMLIPLLLMASGFMALFVTLTIIRIRTEIASRKILSIRSIPNEKHRSNHA